MDENNRMVIYVNSDAGMSRGKYAAQAVHAALLAAGVHHGGPVIVLGVPRDDITSLATVVHDAGWTEVEPGTITAGTDWAATDPKGSTHKRFDHEPISREELEKVYADDTLPWNERNKVGSREYMVRTPLGQHAISEDPTAFDGHAISYRDSWAMDGTLLGYFPKLGTPRAPTSDEPTITVLPSLYVQEMWVKIR